MNTPAKPKKYRRHRGFTRTASLLQDSFRQAGESRGFAVSRLLTHWADIVGTDTARTALPVKVSYAQGGFGATLTLLTTGAAAPMLQAELPKIRDKVNACYGYAAIARIRITQTAATGFAEGQVAFTPAVSTPRAPRTPDPQTLNTARDAAQNVEDAALRHAIEMLGRNIFSNDKT